MDEQLRLMCFCCHPALAQRVQILLTLKLVAGLSTDEIASALLMKTKTVGQSLTRAKKKIKLAGIPFSEPDDLDLAERIIGIHKIIYLMFNEGYHSNSQHSLYRIDLCDESIRIARVLRRVHANNPRSASLLALLLLQHSRSAARLSDSGEPVLLKDQDRSLWNRTLIAEADRIIEHIQKRSMEAPKEYYYQAIIAQKYAPCVDIRRKRLGRHLPYLRGVLLRKARPYRPSLLDKRGIVSKRCGNSPIADGKFST